MRDQVEVPFLNQRVISDRIWSFQMPCSVLNMPKCTISEEKIVLKKE